MKLEKYDFLFWVTIVLVFFFAFWIRVTDLEKNPPGFFCDEAATGYNAYKILMTGKDEYGKSYPLLFQSFGDFKSPVFIYSAVLPVAIFGVSEVSIRFTSVVYGMLGILGTFLFARELFSNRWIGLFSALILAITPWHVHLSRVGFDVNLQSFFVPAMLWSFFFFFKTKSFVSFMVFCLLAVLGFWSYVAARISISVVILLSLCAYPHFLKNVLLKKKSVILTIVVMCVMMGFVYITMKNGSFMGRYKQLTAGESREMLDYPRAYMKYFSPDFLFLKGDTQMPDQNISRHSIIGFGELHHYQLICMAWAIFGIFYLKKYRKMGLFLLALIASYPIAGVVASNVPSATRVAHASALFAVLSGFGMYAMFSIRIRGYRYIGAVCGICVGIFLLVNTSGYLRASKEYESLAYGHEGWQYGFRDSMAKLNAQRLNYDDLIITHRFNAAEILLAFYNVNKLCLNCVIMHNPINIEPDRKQLFSLRSSDIDEAKSLYPDYSFVQIDSIRPPGVAIDELKMGYFTQEKKFK